MLNPWFALVVYFLLGSFVIRFARSSYRRPDEVLSRWYHYLPQRAWSRKLLRGFSVFWMFAGFLIIFSGFVNLPPLSDYRGTLFLTIVVTVAALGTALLLWFTPPGKPKPKRH
jgi:hypothetical protein